MRASLAGLERIVEAADVIVTCLGAMTGIGEDDL